MNKAILIFFLCAGVGVSLGGVTITPHYDNRQMTVLFRSDDSRGGPDTPEVSDRYVYEAAVCESNHVTFTSGHLMNNAYAPTDPSDWVYWRAALAANPYLFLGNHSYAHPVHITSYEDEYLASRIEILDELDYGWQYSYKGQDYQTVFLQFGGCTNVNGETTKWMIATNDYLCLAIGRNIAGVTPEEPFWFGTGDYDQPGWDSNYGVFENAGLGIPFSWVVDGTVPEAIWKQTFADTYDAGGVYESYTHSWQDAVYMGLPENSNGVAFIEHIGNRHDVWYANEESRILYLYLSSQAPPIITVTSENSSEVVFTVDGSALDRDAYGLSFPMTYRVDTPSTLTGTSFYVYYRDTGGWSLLPEKTTNDWYNSENCYRDGVESWGETNVVLVSQGLPQQSDEFTIWVRGTTIPTTTGIGFPQLLKQLP